MNTAENNGDMVRVIEPGVRGAQLNRSAVHVAPICTSPEIANGFIKKVCTFFKLTVRDKFTKLNHFQPMYDELCKKLERTRKELQMSRMVNENLHLKNEALKKKVEELKAMIPSNEILQHYSPTQLATLNEIQELRKCDATFVRLSLQQFYGIEVFGGLKKESIDPSHNLIIRNLFSKRLRGLDISKEEREERNSRFSHLVSRALGTVKHEMRKNMT